MTNFPAHLLVRAARGEAVERPPVWAMRQAGRWDPEFNKLREGLSFYEFSENVELAARASLLPRRFGVDAIILFYDITTLAVAMGLPFTLRPAQGPVPDRPVRTPADVGRLEARPDPERFGHVRRLLQTVRAELGWAQPQHRAVFGAVRRVPRILFVKEGPYLDLMAEAGADVVSLGTRHDLAEARRLYPRLSFQGNVDEGLLRTGTPGQVAEATRR